MAEWQRTLDLSDIWEQAKNRSISAWEFAKIVGDRLEKIKPFAETNEVNTRANMTLEDVVDSFAGFAQDKIEDWDELDYVLRELYDWGDISLDNQFGGKKVCWIKTVI